MEKKQRIQDYCRQFNMGGLTANFDRILTEAESSEVSYIDYTLRLFESEAGHREMRNLERRLKAAGLPLSHDLNTYDYGFDNGLQKSRLSQLRELSWLDQIYNIIFMGPSGTGKTFLAAGLCFDAVQMGYKAYFRTMEQIITALKMKDFTRSAMADYKRLLKAQLIVIDDIMLFPIQKE
ncbi:MAG: ATP-binding protein, partial [Cyclobacteriaceae bacterium]|nr:ATP-binding protein [Cyclobacteriaceae bacterium]